MYLSYSGKLLSNDKTISDYDIKEDSTLVLKPRLLGGAFEVIIKTLKGDHIPIEIEESDRVSDLKIKIEELVGIAPEEQRLICWAKELEDDDEYIESTNLFDNCTIHVFIKTEIQIFVKGFEEKINCFDSW